MEQYHLELLAIIAKLENRLCCPTHCCVFVNRYSIVGVDDWSAEFMMIVSNDSSSVIVIIFDWLQGRMERFSGFFLLHSHTY